MKTTPRPFRPSIEGTVAVFAIPLLLVFWAGAGWMAFHLWKLSIDLAVWIGLLPHACRP